MGKKVFIFVVILILLLVGCSKEVKYEDGLYFAIQDEFSEQSGFKSTVTFEIKDGKFVSVDWNAVKNDGGADNLDGWWSIPFNTGYNNFFIFLALALMPSYDWFPILF